MSNIFDIKEVAMSFEEKSTWVSALLSLLVLAGYSIFALGQLRSLPVAQIAYQWPLIISIGAMIVLTVVGTVLMSIGSAVAAKIRGGSTEDIDRKDERDEGIGRRGDLLGYYASSVASLGALALAMLRCDQFWIANALFLALVVGGLVSSAAKLIAYRRGF
jgi:hypothetical protein